MTASEDDIKTHFDSLCSGAGSVITVKLWSLRRTLHALVEFTTHEAAKMCEGEYKCLIGKNISAKLVVQKSESRSPPTLSLSAAGAETKGAGEMVDKVIFHPRLKKRKAEEIEDGNLKAKEEGNSIKKASAVVNAGQPSSYDSLKQASPDSDAGLPVHGCEVCKDSFPVTSLLLCNADVPFAAKHALCGGCLDSYAKDQLVDQRITVGDVRCTCDRDGMKAEERCSAKPWTIDDLSNVLSKETMALLLKASYNALQSSQQIIEQQRKQAEQVGLDKFARAKREADELATTARADKLIAIRNRMIEEVMYNRCGRCQAPFLDFDGCAALTCGNKACAAGFCAICLLDCGTDAHAHVQQTHGNVWVSKEEFNRSHRDRHLRLLQQQFDALTGDVYDAAFKRDLLMAMEVDLRGKGLRPEDINIPMDPRTQAAATGAAIGARAIDRAAPGARARFPHQGHRLGDTPADVFVADFRDQLTGMLGRPLNGTELSMDAETLQEHILRFIEPNLRAYPR